MVRVMFSRLRVGQSFGLAICGLLFHSLSLASGEAWAAEAEAAPSILVVRNQAELITTLCAADRRNDHILVLPAALFVDSEEVLCADGPYRLYRIISPEDKDDFLYFLDPPFGHQKRLACDGKAGRAMTFVGVNCRSD